MRYKINGFHLKLIAVITMLIDHFGATVVERMQVQPMSFWADWNPHVLFVADGMMRSIGRMAFPIYCFLLVEGFHYTRSRAKYAFRMLIFAVLSEIPFDMAFNSKVVEFGYNNVFITLLLGLLTIWGVDAVNERWGMKKQELTEKQRILGMAGQIAIVALGAAMAEVLATDYSGGGLLAIAGIYFVYREGRALMAFFIGVMILGVLVNPSEFLAIFMMIPMAMYDGTRGKQMKYFFYTFYPAHLLLLDLLVVLMGMRLIY